MTDANCFAAREPARLSYNIAEFCAAVGVGRTKVYQLIKDGHLKTVDLGGRTVIMHETAVEMLRSREKQSLGKSPGKSSA